MTCLINCVNINIINVAYCYVAPGGKMKGCLLYLAGLVLAVYIAVQKSSSSWLSGIKWFMITFLVVNSLISAYCIYVGVQQSKAESPREE